MRRFALLACSTALACVYVDRPVVRGPVTIVAGSGTSARAAFVFVSARDTEDKWSKSQLYLSDATGQVVTNITNDAQANWSPSLSPDGTRIVFVSSRDQGNNLYSMNIDGSDVRRLTAQVWSPSHPRWSAAQVIAFQGQVEGSHDAVWSMPAEGGTEVQVTTPGRDESDDGGLAFVDGGATIVFSRYDRPTQDRDLFVVPTAGGSPPLPLTRTPKLSETSPVASHDGRLLAYRETSMGPATRESIVVLEVGTWREVTRVAPPSPVQFNVSSLDFTADDRGFVFGADATDVGGSLQNLHGEIFTIDLAATRLVRVTKNAAYDGEPVSLLGR